MAVRRSFAHSLSPLLAVLVAGCGVRSALDADVGPDATVADGSPGSGAGSATGSGSVRGQDAGHPQPDAGGTDATRDAGSDVATRDGGSDACVIREFPTPCGDAGVSVKLMYDGGICIGSVCSEDWLSIAGPNDASVPFLRGLIPCSSCAECERDRTIATTDAPSQGRLPVRCRSRGTARPSRPRRVRAAGLPVRRHRAQPPAPTPRRCASICPRPKPASRGATLRCPCPTCKTFSFTWPPSQAGATVTWSP